MARALASIGYFLFGGAVVASFLSVGCVHAPLNQRLVGKPEVDYRLQPRNPPKERDDLLVGLFFSGGGTRAAAFSYGVLQELRATEIATPERSITLLSQVDLISAVSGGAFTAAYYCLFGDETFAAFEHDVLKRELQGALFWGCLRPDNIARLSSAYYGRSDLAASYYDRHIFQHRTFGDLARIPNRPYLVINATDLSTGARFGFTQHSFDLIGSDLSTFPVARAVAASTAVPLALTPVTLRNYANANSRETALPAVIDGALTDRFQQLLTDLNSYREDSERSYVHLVDGGVADNLGLRAMQEFAMLHGGLVGTLKRPRLQRTLKIVVIVVDAAGHYDGHWDRREAAPGTVSVLKAVSQSLLRQSSFETSDVFKRSMELWRLEWRERKARTRDGEQAPDLEFYLINVNFAAVADVNARGYFYNISTALTLPEETVDKLTAVGRSVLRDNPEYRRLLRDLGAAGH